MSSTSSSTSPPLPTSQQIQQSIQQLSYLSTLLDSSASKHLDDPTQAPQSSESRFPGLVEILPHLLAPLTDLTRLQAAASTDGRPTGADGPVGKKPVASAPLATKVQPSPSLATYRPLASQVSSILSQLMSGVRDETGEGVREAIRIAEDVLESQSGKRGREGEGLTREEKREIILSRRRKRRATAQARLDQGAPALPLIASASSPKIPKTLSFDALIKSVAPTEGEAAGDAGSQSSTESIRASINARLESIRSNCKAFDKLLAEQPPGTNAAASAQTAPKKKSERPRIWIAQLVHDDQESTETGSSHRICHGIIRVRLPEVGDGLLWFQCNSKEAGWSTQITKVNLRTSAEIEAGEVLIKTKGISHLHLPSSSAMLRELTMHMLRRIAWCNGSPDPLSTITEIVLRILALRSLYKPPPPTLEQLSLTRKQDEQLRMLTGVEMATQQDKEKHVGVAGWLDSKAEADGAADSVGVRWAWCVGEGEGDAGNGQWLAFVN